MNPPNETPIPSVDARRRHLILGTAGHIDHGKTSLIKALTGTDTDRLPEEKRRGVTIELGFAELTAGGFEFGVVDVPGHERFVRTMVSGATGIDVALLVVAADDSVMPQTVEHVEILSLLGVRRGIVAITKCDLADAELVELVREDAAQLLVDNGLPEWPTTCVSSTDRTGLEELLSELARVAAGASALGETGAFRQAIDRVFTVAGRGTVVTGSVLQGTVAAGETLELLPAGHAVRVRDVQTHRRSADAVQAGQRAALNLIGVDREQINPGDELATPGYLTPAWIVDARVRLVASLAKPIKPMSRVRFAVGTTEVVGRLVPYSAELGPAGTEGMAQLRLTAPVPVEYGQRFILRHENASRTIGGGSVLRFGPRRARRLFAGHRAGLEVMESPDEVQRIEEVLHLAGFKRPTDLALAAATGVPLGTIESILAGLEEQGGLVPIAGSAFPIAVGTVDDLLARAEHWLERFHQANAEEPGCLSDRFVGWLERKSQKGVGRALFERLVSKRRVKVFGRYTCLPKFAPAVSRQDERILAAVVSEIEAAAFQPPAPAKLKAAAQCDGKRIERLIKIAVAHGALVRIDSTIHLAAAVEVRLRETVREMVAAGDEVTVAALRERLDSSRKYMVPILEHLDRVGFTRREGDTRVLTESPSR
ncbi:MAG: selenocysteine-specific translation elongation factor [bacterium]|nr:selenocysteine-specific translation elongation factor [bacterium]